MTPVRRLKRLILLGLAWSIFGSISPTQNVYSSTKELELAGSADRQRPHIEHHTFYTDTDVPLRGENPRWDWGQYRNDDNWWLKLRDTYHLNTLRILCYRSPIHGDEFEPVPVENMLPQLDAWVEAASDWGFYVIIDYHPVGGHDPDEMAAWWDVVAPRYSNRTHVLYEISNEPGPGIFYARDVLEPIRIQIQQDAPETPLIFWSLANARENNLNMILTKTPEYLNANWDRDAVGIHMYHDYVISGVENLRNTYPLLNTEIGGFNEEDYMSVTRDAENLGISWIWLDGATFDRVSPSTVTWDIDPYFDNPPPVESTFADVPSSHPYYDEIESLYSSGYTAGCGTDPLIYCPDETMDRAESAVFVGRGLHGADYSPEDPAQQTFADLPLGSWAARWAQSLWSDEFTSGCNAEPLAYCPWEGHTRAEGAVFYLRMLHGSDFEPVNASGIFTDVSTEMWYARWAEAAFDAGLIPACSSTPLQFCPDAPLDRGLGAYMMVRAKELNSPALTE
jgi:hypothetical protein